MSLNEMEAFSSWLGGEMPSLLLSALESETW